MYVVTFMIRLFPKLGVAGLDVDVEDDEEDDDAGERGQPQVGDVEHVDDRVGLEDLLVTLGGDVAGGVQEQTGERRDHTTTDLRAQRRAREHEALDPLAGAQEHVLAGLRQQRRQGPLQRRLGESRHR